MKIFSRSIDAAIFGGACVLFSCSASQVLAQAAASAQDVKTVAVALKVNDDFESPNTPWQSNGTATFSRVGEEVRSGKSALHISITAQQTPNFQQ